MTTTKKARTTKPTSTTAAVLAQVAELREQAVTAPAKAPRNTTPDLTLVPGKAFKPRTDQIVEKKAEGKGNFAQQHNWDALVAAIQAHGGAITYAEAVQAVLDAGKAGGYEKTCNARGFVQGRVRGGHLVAA